MVRQPEPPPAESIPRFRLASGRELLLPALWPVEQLAGLIRALEAAV
jgi:hypothetical protein